MHRLAPFLLFALSFVTAILMPTTQALHIPPSLHSAKVEAAASHSDSVKPVQVAQGIPPAQVASNSTQAPTPPAEAPQTAPAQPDSSDHNALMAAAGIAENDYGYVDYIVSHESGWCSTKWEGENYCPATAIALYDWSNPYRGYGECQSTAANKMATAGDDWQDNPVTQLKWCNVYSQSRYGGWQQSYTHWISSRNW